MFPTAFNVEQPAESDTTTEFSNENNENENHQSDEGN